jgi:hypothetical protein
MRISRKRWLALTSAAAVITTTTVFAAVNAYADPGGTVTGHVLDNGTRSRCCRADVHRRRVGLPRDVFTDASGAFGFDNVPPAAYRVELPATGQHDLLRPQCDDVRGFRADRGRRRGDRDSGRSGPATRLDLRTPESVRRYGRERNVQGIGNGTSFFTFTDGAGNYTMPFVWVDTYRIQFNPQGAPTQYAHQRPDFISADLFTVTAGSNLTVDDTLMPSGFITGRITNQARLHPSPTSRSSMPTRRSSSRLPPHSPTSTEPIESASCRGRTR